MKHPYGECSYCDNGNEHPDDEPRKEQSRALHLYYEVPFRGKTLNVDDVWDAFDMRPRLAAAFKYLVRAGKKPNETYAKDLSKAIDYIRREIEANRNT